MLEHDAAVGTGRHHRLALDRDAAGLGRQEAADQVEQGRFPAAGGAKQRQKFARADFKRDIGQSQHGAPARRAVGVVHPLDDDLGLII